MRSNSSIDLKLHQLVSSSLRDLAINERLGRLLVSTSDILVAPHADVTMRAEADIQWRRPVALNLHEFSAYLSFGRLDNFMIPHTKFFPLRLSDFIDSSEVSQLSDWEYLDRLWVGEAVGFSEWLRPESTPQHLGSLALDLADLPQSTVDSCLSAIDLPLNRGMNLPQIQAVLGPPSGSHCFVQDRTTYEFKLGGAELYDISCTVLADGGLIYLVVTVPEAEPNN